MSYTYYPGCSAKGTGRSYEESLRAVFGALGTGLDELEDWNCCGATGYPAVDAAKAAALSARNLALAESAQPGPEPVDVIAPCAGCYRALLKTERTFADGGAVAARVGGALDAAGLRYEGRARARHPLDVLVNDIGLDRIAEAAVRPLAGLRVACYYGCLLVRPYATFDDRRSPTSMERLLEAAAPSPSTGRCGRAAAAAPVTAAGRSSARSPKRHCGSATGCWRTRSGAARTRSPRSARCASSTWRRSRAR